MNKIASDENRPDSGPRTVWEFFDKWLHKLALGGERLAPVVKTAVIGAACIWLALVVWRIWLISRALTTFGVDVFADLPVDAKTHDLIRTGLNVLIMFAPDAIFAYIVLGRHVQFWQGWTAVALACAVGASWWATHEPGLGTHCYVVTPDRGLIKSYAKKNGECGVDRGSGLQMSPVTSEILPSIRALELGVKPQKKEISAIDADKIFDTRDGRSLYWFHQTPRGEFDIYDGPGFDGATMTPLQPVTPRNADKIARYVKQRQEADRAAKEKLRSEEKAAADRRLAQAEKESQRLAEATREAIRLADEKAAAERRVAEASREVQRQAEMSRNSFKSAGERTLTETRQVEAERRRICVTFNSKLICDND